MGYFPAFVKLDDKKILIVGGGNIAYEKLVKILDFTKNISIISPQFSDNILKKINQYNLKFDTRVYQTGDIKEFCIVIVGVDDLTLQSQIFEESKQYKCLCNCVDSVKYCDFIFPSYIKKDDLTIAISTSGNSPAMAKHLKKYLKNLIPDGISEFLQEMKNFRKTMPKGKKRMQFLDKKAKDYIDSWTKK
ncbi:MAG: bifunctional precorrin-2 dehydrogenase/sirohydrochlorin ferrochelatase [Sulfurimonas sp.]|nr:bifunctional precorrin-2 dehydrogenase/sirohydrochlorin ferrochelatase [Sulfurimonas sp.]